MMKTLLFARRNLSLTAASFTATKAHSATLSARLKLGNLQPPGERSLNARFLDAGDDYVIVLWRQRGVSSDGEKFDEPVVSVYKMRDRKIVESQMFHSDTKAVLQFLAGKN
jgi:hypothetical protein